MDRISGSPCPLVSGWLRPVEGSTQREVRDRDSGVSSLSMDSMGWLGPPLKAAACLVSLPKQFSHQLLTWSIYLYFLYTLHILFKSLFTKISPNIMSEQSVSSETFTHLSCHPRPVFCCGGCWPQGVSRISDLLGHQPIWILYSFSFGYFISLYLPSIVTCTPLMFELFRKLPK